MTKLELLGELPIVFMTSFSLQGATAVICCQVLPTQLSSTRSQLWFDS